MGISSDFMEQVMKKVDQHIHFKELDKKIDQYDRVQAYLLMVHQVEKTIMSADRRFGEAEAFVD